jgi:membrane protease YdiL (CAAX protease family)
LKLNGDDATQIATDLMRDGTTYRQVVSAAWLCLLALLAIIGPGNRAGWMDRLGLHPVRSIPVLVWTGLTALALAGTSVLLDPLMDETTREALRIMGEGVHSPFWFVAALVVAAPLLEELVFRGYAFSGLIGRTGPWGAILFPALIFTACHIQYGPAGLAYILAIGILLGTLRWQTGSVYPGIAVHMANNLVQAVVMLRDAAGP